MDNQVKQQPKNGEATIQDVLDTMNGFATNVEDRFQEMGGRFSRIEEKLVAHDDRFSRIEEKLVAHDDRFSRIEETMATKTDLNEIKNILDAVATGVVKIQQDHIFALEWMKRLQEKVDQQEQDIRQIKLHLKLA